MTLLRVTLSMVLASAVGVFVIDHDPSWRAWFLVLTLSFWLGNNAIRTEEG